MKKLFLTLISCFVLVALGCQENSITEPLSSEVAEKDRFQEDTYNHGFIKLEGMLRDPSRPLNCCLVIRGEIEYEHRLVFVDPDQQTSSYYVSLNLAIEAEVMDPRLPTVPTWPISETSTDKIDVQLEQVQYLTKYFRLQGREDVMYLVCKFIVTTDYVLLDGMWLQTNRSHFSINNVR